MSKKSQPDSPTHLRFAVLASDVALFTVRDNQLLVRLVRVDRPPYFPNTKGLLGGLIDPKETAEEATLRLIKQKGYINGAVYIEQLCTFSDLNRDPRGRVVAVAYIGLAVWENLSLLERENTSLAWWERVEDALNLAYDHDTMLKVAVRRLRSKSTYTTLIQKFMPTEFTLTELENAYESILKTDLDKRNFRKKIKKLKIVRGLKRKRKGGKFRPAELYSFRSSTVEEIEIL